MSEIGNDAAQATMNLSASVLKRMGTLIVKFLKHLMEREDHKLNKDRAKAEKIELGKVLADHKLDHTAGYVSAKKLMKSGDPLIHTDGIRGEDMARFREIAKREGLVYTCAEHDGLDGGKTLIVMHRERDTAHVKEIADRMNRERMAGRDDRGAAEESRAGRDAGKNAARGNDGRRPMAEYKAEIARRKSAAAKGQAPEQARAAGNMAKAATAPAR